MLIATPSQAALQRTREIKMNMISTPRSSIANRRRTIVSRASGHRPETRCGTAAVEFAVCLPVIVLLVFGSIEASAFIFLKQALTVASYEGIREAASVNGTTASATAKAQAILDSRQVNDFTIAFPSGTPESRVRGEQVACAVTAPTQTNSPLAGQFITNQVLTAQVVMLKE